MFNQPCTSVDLTPRVVSVFCFDDISEECMFAMLSIYTRCEQEVRNRRFECTMVETGSSGNKLTPGLIIQPVPQGRVVPRAWKMTNLTPVHI